MAGIRQATDEYAGTTSMGFLMQLLAIVVTGLAAWTLWAAVADDWRLTLRGQPIGVRLRRLCRGQAAAGLAWLVGTTLTGGLRVGVARLVQPHDRPVLAIPILACALVAWFAVNTIVRIQRTTTVPLVAFGAFASGTTWALPICLGVPFEVMMWIVVATLSVSWISLHRAMAR